MLREEVEKLLNMIEEVDRNFQVRPNSVSAWFNLLPEKMPYFWARNFTVEHFKVYPNYPKPYLYQQAWDEHVKDWLKTRDTVHQRLGFDCGKPGHDDASSIWHTKEDENGKLWAHRCPDYVGGKK
jgi:hypothetical protein